MIQKQCQATIVASVGPDPNNNNYSTPTSAYNNGEWGLGYDGEIPITGSELSSPASIETVNDELNIPHSDPLKEHLYPHQILAIENKKDKHKCLINMWCGTGKTRTFTISLFQDNQNLNVIVFPSLGLINQYNNDYFLNPNPIFKENF